MKILLPLAAIAFIALTPAGSVAAQAARMGPFSVQAGTGPNATLQPPAPTDLTVTMNKSIILEHPGGIRRVSVTNPEIAEAVAVSSTELLINGKSPGDTSLILWDSRGPQQLRRPCPVEPLEIGYGSK